MPHPIKNTTCFAGHRDAALAASIDVKFDFHPPAGIRIKHLVKNSTDIGRGSNSFTLFKMAAQMDFPNGLQSSRVAPANASGTAFRFNVDVEKYPIGLIKSENGVWFATIPLLPGQYVYRFIADGMGTRIDVSPNPRQIRVSRGSPGWRSTKAE